MIEGCTSRKIRLVCVRREKVGSSSWQMQPPVWRRAQDNGRLQTQPMCEFSERGMDRAYLYS